MEHQRLDNNGNSSNDEVRTDGARHGPRDERVPKTCKGGGEAGTAGVLSGLVEAPLPCFGCGIGWFSFILGFLFPPFWFYAAVLYLENHNLKDPRERPGLAASAVAALICSATVLISVLAVFCLRFTQWHY